MHTLRILTLDLYSLSIKRRGGSKIQIEINQSMFGWLYDIILIKMKNIKKCLFVTLICLAVKSIEEVRQIVGTIANCFL